MQFEIDIIKSLQVGRSPFWDFFFKYFSCIGTVWAVFVIAIILFLFKKRWPAFWFLVVEGFSYILGFFMKLFISRERPYLFTDEVIPITTTDGFSMPSGHSLCAVAMAICLVYIFWENKKYWQRSLMIAGAITFIVLMGISRMYLGQHYLTDVLVGYTLGYCVCLVAYWVRNPVVRLVNILLDRVGLEKWKMKVPPIPKVYDDMAEPVKVQGEVINSKASANKIEKKEDK